LTKSKQGEPVGYLVDVSVVT